MNVTCQEENHNYKPLTLICTNPECQSARLLCSKCLITTHKDCIKYVVDVEDVFNRCFMANINWILDSDVKEAIHLLTKHKLDGTKGQLYKVYEGMVNSEFDKLTRYFIRRISEIKDKALKQAKQLFNGVDSNLRGFKDKLENIYNFDKFLGILQPLQMEEKDFEQVNQELTSFFEDINYQRYEQAELKKMSCDVRKQIEDCLTLNLEPFETFKAKIPFEIFDESSSSSVRKSWTWSTLRKSSSITLNDDNTKAEKKSGSPISSTAILGSEQMSQGAYKWEIEVPKKCICFGVIETQLVKNLESFPSQSSIGLGTGGELYQLEKVQGLVDYKNKTYCCELNMDDGVFTISCDQNIIAKQDNLKGKTLIPFVSMYYAGSAVKLEIL